jgi:uncharacterized protein YggE
MRRSIISATIVLTMFLATSALAEDHTDRSMHVSGTGVVSVAPDLAILSLGVEAQERSAAAAMRALTAQMTALFETLDAAGITGADRQTSGLTLSPIWNNPAEGRTRQIAGYAARNMLTVRVTEIDTTGQVIDALADAGANRFTSLRFDLADRRPAEDEARRRAAAAAMAKANLYAEATGVTLGDLMDLSENFSGGPRPMAEMAMLRSDAAMPVAAGELDISVTVNMRFELED